MSIFKTACEAEADLWLDTGYGCGLIRTRNSVVIGGAPIFKSLIGQSFWDFAHRGWKVKELTIMHEGLVNVVNSRSIPDKFKGGTVTLYSFRLEGVDQWFNCGQKAPNFGKGQTIRFNMKGKNVDTDSVEIVSHGITSATAQQAPSVTPPATSGAGSISRDDYWARKDARDLEKDARFQAVSEPRMALSVATECAAQVISAGLASDSIGFGNTAKSKRQDLLVDAVKHVALELAVFIHSAPELLASYEAGVTADIFETEEED